MDSVKSCLGDFLATPIFKVVSVHFILFFCVLSLCTAFLELYLSNIVSFLNSFGFQTSNLSSLVVLQPNAVMFICLHIILFSSRTIMNHVDQGISFGYWSQSVSLSSDDKFFLQTKNCLFFLT